MPAKTHGMSTHPIYRIWAGMKRRCYKEKCKDYKYYGGRGIIICEEWINSSVKFIEWAILNGWGRGKTIDRINNDGNYEPGNCRFVELSKNINNRRLMRSTNISGYCGVCIDNNDKRNIKSKYRARICLNGKNKFLGRFKSPRLAALRYDVEAYLLNDGRPRNFILKENDI